MSLEDKWSPAQRDVFAERMTKYGLTYDQGLKLRHKAKTDLFFLAKHLLGYELMTEDTHREITNFFVKKDPSFQEFADFATNYDDLHDRLLLVPRGGFKALDLDTEVPTPSGIRLLRDIHTGDTVWGDDGHPCTVRGESPIHLDRECYQLTFSTGEQVIADADHLWITDARRDRDRRKGRGGKTSGPQPSVKTTRQIAATLMCRTEHNHRVAVAGAIALPQRSYSIPPYVLGCWLGDGTSANSNFTCADPQIIDEIKSEGEILRKAEYGGDYLYVFNGGDTHPDYRNHTTSFAARLRHLNLLDNKHIPEEYLLGSYAQRLALLTGLMDTDGTCDVRGHCTFSNTNRVLAYQVRELIASLGLKPFAVCEYDTMLDGRVIGAGYQIGFKAYKDTPVFRVTRKHQRQVEQKKSTLSKHRQITAAVQVDSRPVKCLMVDSPNHTYLVTRAYIPTHNSTIDICDAIQYLITWPNISILILTGVLNLAKAFVEELTSHFVLGEDDMPRLLPDDKPSLFQIMFPEHCIQARHALKGRFTTPARTNLSIREPSVMVGSIEASMVGFHFDVCKFDDVVTSENSRLPERIETINKFISIDKAMLHPYGFIDTIGTWYDINDFYGQTIAAEEEIKKHGGEPLTNILLRSALWPKPGCNKPEPEMTEDDYVLWFPQRLSYKFLMREKRRDPIGFALKYLNDPRQAHASQFSRDLLVNCTKSWNQLPREGLICTAWDIAYSTAHYADYTVGITGLFSQGRVFILDMVRGRYNDFELPKIIAQTAHKWRAARVAIEDSVGTRWLQREIRREMDIIKYRTSLEYVTLGLGSKANSKEVKAKPVIRLLGDGRLILSSAIPKVDDLYDELEKFPKGSNDDIVSALSLLVNHYMPMADIATTVVIQELESASRVNADRMFGAGQFRDPEDVPSPRSEYGYLPPILGELSEFE